MQNQTKERGITLIALIVTLIILVILAAVTIRAVFGDKIIHYAVEGAKDYKIEQNKEQILLLLESIKLENMLQRKETTLSNIAEEMDKENWVNEAFANIDTGITNDDVIVKTKDGYVFQVYYDEKEGQQFIEYLGRDDKLQIPNLLASYDKENENINVNASCEGGIEKIELIYEGNIESAVKDTNIASFKANESGWYTVKVTAKNGKLRYAVVKASNALDAPTFEVIEGNKGLEDWYTTDVKIRINAKGATKIRYRITGGMNVGNRDVTGTTAELTINEEGESTITAYAIDKEGKESEQAGIYTIKLDKNPPNKAEIKVTDYGKETINVTAEGEDLGSGIASYTFQKSIVNSTSGFDEGETVTTVEGNTTYQYTGLAEGRTYWLRVLVKDKAGNTKTGDVVEQKTKALKIGDYVDYTPPTTNNNFLASSTYSGYSSNQTYTPTPELKWRILSKSASTIELISEKGDNNKFNLSGYKGYNNAVKLLNEACNKMYVNKEKGATTARSLKIEDIEAYYTGTKATQTVRSITLAYYPEIFAQEEGGNIDGKGYGSLGRSVQNSYIIQSSTKQANTFKAKDTYYAFTMSTDNMKSQIWVDIFSSSNFHFLASRCGYIANPTGRGLSRIFLVSTVSNNNVTGMWIYRSDNSVSDFGGRALRPIVTINLTSVTVGDTGEGTTDSPYSIVKK